HRVGHLSVSAGITVEPDRAEAGDGAAIGPDAQILPSAVPERHRTLGQAERGIDRELLVRSLLAAGGAQPLAALAAALAGKAPELDQVHGDPVGPVAEMDGTAGLARVVAQGIELRVVESVDERGRPAALACREIGHHKNSLPQRTRR